MKQIVVIGIVLLAATGASGDGKMFGPAPVTMPDQQALLVWDDGVETLVIESHFSGKGDQFAWILPLPAAPEIEETTTGVLPTLQLLTSPAVEQDGPSFPAWVLVMPLIAWLLATRRYRAIAIWGTAAAVAFLLLVYGFLVESQSAYEAQSQPGPVQVLDRRIVGGQEAVVLAGRDGKSVVTWLSDNGFTPPPGIEPVIADYVKRGWVFVATRLATSLGEGDVAAIKPLAFRFTTDEPVYPMKLTGVDARVPLDLDLFVVSDQRAEVKGMDTAYCGSRSGGAEVTFPVEHAALKRVVGDEPIITKLAATLSPKQMGEDLTVHWTRYKPHRDVIYRQRAVSAISMHACFTYIGVGLVIVGFLVGRFQQSGATAWLLVAVVLAIGLIVDWGIRRSLPVAPPRTVSYEDAGPRKSFGYSYLPDWLVKRMAEQPPDTPIEAAFVDRLLQKEVDAERWDEYNLRNAYTGQRLRYEDSPGNFTVKRTDEGVRITWYGRYGQPVRDMRDLDRRDFLP